MGNTMGLKNSVLGYGNGQKYAIGSAEYEWFLWKVTDYIEIMSKLDSFFLDSSMQEAFILDLKLR